MAKIYAYPGVYDTTDEYRDNIDYANALAVKAEQINFGEVQDRSSEVIYSTCLMDGRIVCVYGPKPEEFFKLNGDPVFKVKVYLRGEEIGCTEIRVPVFGIFRRVKPDPYYWGKNSPTPLNLPQSVLDEIDLMGKEFANLYRVRLEYRRMVRDEILRIVQAS